MNIEQLKAACEAGCRIQILGMDGWINPTFELEFKGQPSDYRVHPDDLHKVAQVPCSGKSRDALAELAYHTWADTAPAPDGNHWPKWQAVAAALSATQARPDGGEAVNVAENAARAMYNEYSGNHPTIHCNRFPAWNELSGNSRAEWPDKVVAADTGDAEADNLIGRLMHADPTFSDCTDAAAFIRKQVLSQPSAPVVDEGPRYFVSGPALSFRAYALDQAERLLKMAGVDRDDWTITDLTKQPAKEPKQ